MEIKQLKALVMIADTGSFSAAADRLNLTQSAISHQMRQLEEHLGETLLIRGKPHVVPSPAGVRVIASARTILAELTSIGEMFSPSESSRVSGELTVAATSVGMTYLYGDLCEGFMRRYPNIELIFRSAESAEEATRSVEKGIAEVGFVPLVHAHSSMQCLLLGRTEDALIVAPSHPLAKRTSVSVSEVMQWPFVRFHTGSGSRAQSDKIFAETGYPRIATESNEMEFVKRVVSMGHATAIIPVMAVSQEVRHQKLKALQIEEHRSAMEFGLVHLPAVRLRTLDVFKSYCIEVRGPALRTLSVRNPDTPFFHCR